MTTTPDSRAALRARMQWEPMGTESMGQSIQTRIHSAPAGVSLEPDGGGAWRWWSWGFVGLPGGQVDGKNETESGAKQDAEYWLSGMFHRLDALAEVQRLTAERDVLRAAVQRVQASLKDEALCNSGPALRVWLLEVLEGK